MNDQTPHYVTYAPQDYLNPDWAAHDSHIGLHVNEWKKYINEDLRKAWMDFSPTQRALIAYNAWEIAMQEDWE